jgi:hypothetical protein
MISNSREILKHVKDLEIKPIQFGTALVIDSWVLEPKSNTGKKAR